MSTNIEIAKEPMKASSRMNAFRSFWHIFISRKIVIFGFVIILALIITAIFAPLLAPYDPYKVNISQSLLLPSHKHLLGTDILGRDTLSRVIYGSRISLMIGIFAVGVGSFLGIMLGLVAGYSRGALFTIIMRLMDALMSIPPIVLAMVIIVTLGSGLRNLILALGISLVPLYSRLTCGLVLSTKENDYIIACRSMGATIPRIMLRHILPNCFPPLIVVLTMQMGMIMLAEAGLSFLGVGLKPPTAAWGAMVSEGYQYLLSNPMLSLAPGFAIMLVVFAFNMLGDGLRDALDPKLRGTI